MSQIAALIKRLRSEPSNMSQSEISRRTGIPQPRVSRWESGDVAAGADDALKLIELAHEMGVSDAATSPATTAQAATENVAGGV